MIVAGVDPGTIRMGICIADFSDRGAVEVRKVLVCETIECRLKDRIRRLTTLGAMLRGRFNRFDPFLVVLERAYVGLGKGSAIALGEARGVVMMSSNLDGEIMDLTAAEARRIVCGKGNATKAFVASVVNRLLSLDGRAGPDATDAGCLAIAGASLYSKGSHHGMD